MTKPAAATRSLVVEREMPHPPAQECAALAVASLTNRPDKETRETWAKGVAAWRSEHHCPLVFGRVE